MSFILAVAPNLLKGRVALERKKFRKFQILAVVALHQTFLIEIYVTRFMFLN